MCVCVCIVRLLSCVVRTVCGSSKVKAAPSTRCPSPIGAMVAEYPAGEPCPPSPPRPAFGAFGNQMQGWTRSWAISQVGRRGGQWQLEQFEVDLKLGMVHERWVKLPGMANIDHPDLGDGMRAIMMNTNSRQGRQAKPKQATLA